MVARLLGLSFLFAVINLMASSEQQLDLRIPVVDMRDYSDPEKQGAFLDVLYGAMTQVGFFAVRHSGVDAEVIREAYAEAEDFFRQSHDLKMQCFQRESKGQRGFVPGETAKGATRKDRKEFYHIGREKLLPQNVWPEQASFKTALTTLFEELEHYVIPLQEAIIATINRNTDAELPLNILNRTTIEEGDFLLRALYYPALRDEETGNVNQPLYWAAPHTDIDYLAILPYATEKGLQVEMNGQWLNVVVPQDAFIVNIGDMLENLTNGLFVSARHRVVTQEANKDRFSMVLFVHPTDNTPLDPLPACIALTGGTQLYASGTRQEFLWERLIELDIAPGLLASYAKTGHTERQLQYGRQSPQVVELLLKNGLASPDLMKELKNRKMAD